MLIGTGRVIFDGRRGSYHQLLPGMMELLALKEWPLEREGPSGGADGRTAPALRVGQNDGCHLAMASRLLLCMAGLAGVPTFSTIGMVSVVLEGEKMGGTYMMVNDPVCGADVEEARAKVTAHYREKRFYFCARPCLDRFLEMPKQFVDAELAAGVVRNDFMF